MLADGEWHISPRQTDDKPLEDLINPEGTKQDEEQDAKTPAKNTNAGNVPHSKPSGNQR